LATKLKKLLSNKYFIILATLLTGIVGIGVVLAADLRFAIQAGLLANDYKPVIDWALEVKAAPFSPTETTLRADQIEGLPVRLQALAESCDATLVIKKKLAVDCKNFQEAVDLLVEIEPYIIEHLESPHTYLILLQNSEELRASGGFMGSFARVTVGGNGIESFEIQDIYEPDGQFTGYVPAPPGVFEYLSSGNGLRLPDANWAADFPSAAQTILTYFSFGKESAIDGLVAINSSLIEKILTVTGDIYLPDYQTNISATTFTELARSDRNSFFPGSKQKQHFLSSFMNQIKIRVSELSQNQQQQLLTIFLDSISTKDTLLHSTNPDLQLFLESRQATGATAYHSQPNTNYLYLLESNVGINKTNKHVERQIDVDLSGYQATITITFTNNNPTQPPQDSNDENLNYANYQRVLVNPNWQLYAVVIDGQEIEKEAIDDHQITSKSGATFRQIGFLHKVNAQETGTVRIRFSKLAQTIAATSESLFIQKQPGQKPTPYQIKWRDSNQTILLDQDTLVKLYNSTHANSSN
jgi:hypothetical protein